MSENMYQRWFVMDTYEPAGRPQMEDQLMDYAKKQWLHCSVYQTFIEGMVKDLKERQEILWNANKRLKKVDIHASSLQAADGVVWLYIGEQHLTLRRIREEIEYAR